MVTIPWFKIDDGFWSHPKVLELSDGAVALWVRAGAYCAGHLTDGLVKKATLRVLGAERDSAVELVLAGLWSESPDGWHFHDWDEYQPTREQVLAERAAATERKRVSRERSRRESRRDTGVTDGGSHGGSHSPPTRPDPTRPDPSTSNEVEVGQRGTKPPPTPFCSRHPEGTDGPCSGCKKARIEWDAANAPAKPTAPDYRNTTQQCADHPGYPLPCDRCRRDAEEAA